MSSNDKSCLYPPFQFASLHDEMYQTAIQSDLVYTFAYIVDAARQATKQNVEFKGIEIDPTTQRALSKPIPPPDSEEVEEKEEEDNQEQETASRTLSKFPSQVIEGDDTIMDENEEEHAYFNSILNSIPGCGTDTTYEEKKEETPVHKILCCGSGGNNNAVLVEEMESRDIEIVEEYKKVEEVKVDPFDLRTFTPKEIQDIIILNQEFLADLYPKSFGPDSISNLMQLLEKLQQTDSSSLEDNSIVVEEFDDSFQETECVYGIVRDSTSKVITLSFRGTEVGINGPTAISNWLTNVNALKVSQPIPQILAEKLPTVERVGIHKGFHDYLMDKTENPLDEEQTTKLDQIKLDLLSILARFPNHRIVITGHSLGGALATLASYYFAIDPDFAQQKPITCINFGAPRVGGYKFSQAIHALQEMKLLRILRVVNKSDSITTLPPGPFYHVGFQITNYDDNEVADGKPVTEMTYLDPYAGFWSKMKRRWSNGIVSNINLGYEHGMNTYIANIENTEPVYADRTLNENYVEEGIVVAD